ATLANEREIETVLRSQRARVVLVIPSRFSDDLLANRSAKVQVLIDGANATTASAAAGYLAAMTQDYSTRISLEALARFSPLLSPRSRGDNRGVALPIDYRPRIWYNPELRSARFMVPGLI